MQAQELDKKTLAKVRVKLITAENSYKEGKYYSTLSKIREIEAIVGENAYEDIQNLKVKALIGNRSFEDAKKELDKLYEMDPSDEIITDIASYEDKIDTGIKAAKKREEEARLRKYLREQRLKREEQERIEKARIERIRKRKKDSIAEVKHNKLHNVLKNFETENCVTCRGSGKERISKEVTCSICKGTGKVKSAIIYGTNRWTYRSCYTCKGKGKRNKREKVNCDTCNGHGVKFRYIGDEYFTDKEIQSYLTAENAPIIKRYARNKRIDLANSHKDRTVASELYFDKNWKEVNKFSPNVEYIRPPVSMLNGLYVVENYYKENNMLRQTYYASDFIGYKPKYVGVAKRFYKSGNLKDYEFYTKESKRLIRIFYGDKEEGKRKDSSYEVALFFFNMDGKVIDDYFSNKGPYVKYILEPEYHTNGVIKYVKVYGPVKHKSKKKIYFELFITDTGVLYKKNICNRKWKVKKTVTY